MAVASPNRRQSHTVVALLEENRDKLDALAGALLEHETLDQDDAYAAAGVTRVDTSEPAPARVAAFTTREA